MNPAVEIIGIFTTKEDKFFFAIGRGYYQEWKGVQELHPGDVVTIPPEVKHWHGAAKDSYCIESIGCI